MSSEHQDSPLNSGHQDSPIAPSARAHVSLPRVESNTPRFSSQVLNVGFLSGIVLAAACLATGALYLYQFLKSTTLAVPQLLLTNTNSDLLDMAIHAQLVVARLALLSCGVFVGMAFGFVGFALFLVGLQAEMDIAGQYEAYHVKIARLSPGVFVILCSVVLITMCATHQTPFEYNRMTSQAPPKPQPQDIPTQIREPKIP